MGGGAGDSFKAALARQRKADAWRNQRQVREVGQSRPQKPLCLRRPHRLGRAAGISATGKYSFLNDPLLSLLQAAKSNVMQERLSAFQQAEDAKMAAFRSLIASAGGGFAIPKRDGA